MHVGLLVPRPLAAFGVLVGKSGLVLMLATSWAVDLAFTLQEYLWDYNKGSQPGDRKGLSGSPGRGLLSILPAVTSLAISLEFS